MQFHDLPTLRIVREMCNDQLKKLDATIDIFQGNKEMVERHLFKKKLIENLLNQVNIEINQKEPNNTI